MGGDSASVSSSIPGQLEEIRARMARNRADIDQLLERADASDDRAVENDVRAEHQRRRVDDLGERLAVDHALIEELRIEGLLQQAHVENLETALRTSRTIGAAMGIVMTHRKVDESGAFRILRQASQDSNTKLRSVADEIVTTGDVSWLPTG
ncbi:ANTAR domain-containing protein [Rothia sp. ARF10]|nr:ANTAR domain-containing protein [Rothia sp. ARF10]